MVLSIGADVKAKLEQDGSRPVWLAEMHLGAIAYLRILNYAAGSGDSFTITFTYSATTVTAMYTAGTQFSLGATNEETAENMAAAVNSDDSLNNRISAYAFQDMLVIHGYAYSTRIQTTVFTDTISIATSDAAAWFSTIEPVDRIYYFMSADGRTASTDVFPIPEIREVQSVSASIDPMTREFSIGDIEIVFDDEDEKSVIRDILKRTFPKGKFIQISIGTDQMLVGDFVPVGGFFIDEVIPARGMISLTCAEIPSVLRDRKFDNRGAPIPRLSQPDAGDPTGTAMNIQVEVKVGSGVISRTYTEGTDWTGNADPGTSLVDLAAAINADAAINPYVVALTNAGGASGETFGLYLLPYANPGATTPAFQNRAVEVKARSSDQGDINIRYVSGTYDAGSSIVTPNVSGWISVHPIRAIRDLFGRAGLTSSRIEETTFLPSTYPTISHWAFSATEQHVIPDSSDDLSRFDNSIQDELCVDLLERLSRMVQGGVVGTEDGKIKFIRRDTTATADRVLTSDDYDEVEWLEQYKTLCNRVSIYGTAFDTSGDNRVLLMQVSESFSQVALNTLGNLNPQEMVIEEPFLGAYVDITTLVSAMTSATDPMTVGNVEAWYAGFSGCHQAESGSGTVATGADVDPGSGRESWYLIWRPTIGDLEYLYVTDAAADSGESSTSRLTAARVQQSETAYVPRQIDSGTGIDEMFNPLDIYSQWEIVATRGALNTPPMEVFGAIVTGAVKMADATIAKAMAEHFIDFAYGVPIAKFRTSMRHIDLQLGDVITADFAQYLNFLQDGADGNTTWEIIGKEIEFPWVVLTVARLNWQFRPSIVLTAEYEEPTEVVASPSEGNLVIDNDFNPVVDASGNRVRAL